jgi:N-acetylneuraminic acid mutarotase
MSVRLKAGVATVVTRIGSILWIAALGCGARTGLDDPYQPGHGSSWAGDGGSSGDDDTGRATAAVLFEGGYLSPQTETWEWNGTAWTQRAVSIARRGSLGSVMASLNGKLVLFGGSADGHYSAETWTWDGSVWTQLGVTGPSARTGGVMAPLNGKLVLFGGRTEDNNIVSDTWTWDGAAWTQLAVAAPPKRDEAVFAPLHGRLILFGGITPSGAGLADTWSWDGATWTELHVSGPPARFGATMAPRAGNLVLFGGFPHSGDLDTNTFSDTWTWDGSAWTQESAAGPPARSNAAMAPFNGTVVLFGGFGGSDRAAGRLGDTWTWDGRVWMRQNVSGPPASDDGVMATY